MKRKILPLIFTFGLTLALVAGCGKDMDQTLSPDDILTSQPTSSQDIESIEPSKEPESAEPSSESPESSQEPESSVEPSQEPDASQEPEAAKPVPVMGLSLAGKRDLPIYCVQTDEPKIALTFDANYGNEYTDTLLEILDKHDVNVTFFATGRWVSEHPEGVKAVIDAGHELGNHGDNHLDMSEQTVEKIKSELMVLHDEVLELTGYDMFLFRPPYGAYNNDVVNTAVECGYYSIQWDVDSLDWMKEDGDEVFKIVTEHKNLGNGSIILCHNGAQSTVDCLDKMIPALKEKGYTFVTVSELIYKDNYHMNHQGRQIPD